MKKFPIVLIVALITLISGLLIEKTACFSTEFKQAKALLNASDLSGFYFGGCDSRTESFSDRQLRKLEGSNLQLSKNLFDVIEERWYSEPTKMIFDKKAGDKLKENGYFVVVIKRCVFSSEKDAQNWLQMAFVVNFFSSFSGKLFEERTYTGKKIGDKCFVFRDDKTFSGSNGSESDLMKGNKSLYFVKNNTAVALYMFHTGGKVRQVVSVSQIENLAETICSRL